MRVLLVSGRYPWPPWTGDRLRCAQLVELLGHRHEVTLLSPKGESGAPSPPTGPVMVTFEPRRGPRRALGVFSSIATGHAGQSGLYHDPALGAAIRRYAPEHDIVVLLLARLARHFDDAGDRPVVVDLVDALSLSFAARARVDRLWLRPFWRLESRLLGRSERRLAARSAATLVVAERDRRHLEHEVRATGPIEVVPVVVTPRPPTDQGTESGPPQIVLTGNLGYFVNRDGAAWWLDTVWPRLRARHPELRFVLAGNRPPERMIRHARDRGAEVIARPPDLRSLIASAAVAIAPLRCGAGLPIKILEAWASGTPVVATSHAAAGVAGRAGRDLLVADEPEAWTRAIEQVLDDSETRARLVAGGREHLREDYAPDVVAERLESALASATSR